MRRYLEALKRVERRSMNIFQLGDWWYMRGLGHMRSIIARETDLSSRYNSSRTGSVLGPVNSSHALKLLSRGHIGTVD
ncbi:hypothetical protein Tco_1152837 [Tanacetum coccineum]